MAAWTAATIRPGVEAASPTGIGSPPVMSTSAPAGTATTTGGLPSGTATTATTLWMPRSKDIATTPGLTAAAPAVGRGVVPVRSERTITPATTNPASARNAI